MLRKINSKIGHFFKLFRYYNPLQVYKYKRGQVYPIHIFFNITSKCNSNCLYCDEWLKKKTTLNFQDFSKIWEKICSKFNPKTILLTGGEIFDHPEIKQILNYLFSKKKVEINGVSSGIFSLDLNKDILSNFNLLYFSLDGPNKKIHSVFRKKSDFYSVVSSIKKAVGLKKKYGLGLKIGVMCVITSKNIAYLSRTADFVYSLGVDELAFSKVIDYNTIKKNIVSRYSLKEENLNVLYSQIKDLKKKYRFIVNTGILSDSEERQGLCFAGRAFFVINEKGNCFPCYGKHKPTVNLIKEDFSEKYLTKSGGLRTCDKNCQYYCTKNLNYHLNKLNIF